VIEELESIRDELRDLTGDLAKVIDRLTDDHDAAELADSDG